MITEIQEFKVLGDHRGQLIALEENRQIPFEVKRVFYIYGTQGSDTNYDFRVATDKWYVSNWSLWLDIVILLKTVKVVLFREGAY